MNETRVGSIGNVLKRVLVLFGLYTLIANVTFLIGYHFLPEGFFRSSPLTTSGQIANQPESFAGQLVFTLLFNLGFQVGLIIVLNFNQVKGMPAAYLVPLYLAVMGGLIPGSNSFVASDLDQYPVREGLALAYSIGMFETLGFILIVAGTVSCGVYQYQSWWQLSKSTQVMKIRDIRLTRWEWLAVGVGVLLVIVSSFRETLMAFNLL